MINAKEKVDSLVKSGQLRLTVIDEELMQIESYEDDDTIVRIYTDPEATAEDILRAIELGRNTKECVHRR
ncbi:MAG: hypothetical protein SPI61_07675 [Ezakiella sp.]|uniref:hypothetical protein n=1 Tax=Ezakiella sp. TaxID=1935205 RepID=UPI002975098E|nr:hypothetical protein [Ezakiella sp.]MDD7731994.1 hypothetical protein [Eubacteriales bacterium]MDY6080587.1 hypothetical protein [Ezakiella sp.]